MVKTVVIGAGAMGLAAAHYALNLGHEVDVVEADAIPGGMAAHFDFDGLSLERFYHFVCKADATTFALMKELGVADKMRWRSTSMAYWIDGRIYRWGDPISLLRFPKLDMISKFRTGLQMFLTTRRTNVDNLENVSTRRWIESGSGRRVFDLLWRRLLALKFYQYADDISAAWIWTRIKRLGTSRRSMFQEELGYIEGGSETLIHALVAAIGQWAGAWCSMRRLEGRSGETGRVTGVRRRQALSGRRGDLDGADPARRPPGAGSAGGGRCLLRGDPQHRCRLRGVLGSGAR